MNGDYDKFRRAGKILNAVFKRVLNRVQPGVSILELCEYIEGEIRANGAQPAFPANIDVNEVAAHYTARIGDDSTIPPNSVVKIDLGAHVDGYIVDAAVTIYFNQAYSMLVKAAREALMNAIGSVKAGVEVSKIGSVVDRTISSYGFKPIKNLTGHLITRYNLHAGKSVPNYDDGSRVRMVEGEVYAIEPFATNGRGLVYDGNVVTIYRLVKTSPKGLPREAKEAVEYIYANFNVLPFTPRWLVRRFGGEAARIINTLANSNVLYQYPILIEGGGGFVAQFEDTVIVHKDGAEPLVGVLDIV